MHDIGTRTTAARTAEGTNDSFSIGSVRQSKMVLRGPTKGSLLEVQSRQFAASNYFLTTREVHVPLLASKRGFRGFSRASEFELEKNNDQTKKSK